MALVNNDALRRCDCEWNERIMRCPRCGYESCPKCAGCLFRQSSLNLPLMFIIIFLPQCREHGFVMSAAKKEDWKEFVGSVLTLIRIERLEEEIDIENLHIEYVARSF